MAVSTVRDARLSIIPVFHRHHHLHRPQMFFSDKYNSSRRWHPNGRGSKRFTLSARYSQAQDLFSSTRLQDSLERLPKLVEDIVQTSVSTGPRGAIRLAQGIQAFIGVGGEWLADVSKVPLYTSLAPFGMFFPFIIGIPFWEVHQVRKECVEKSKPLLQCGFEGDENEHL